MAAGARKRVLMALGVVAVAVVALVIGLALGGGDDDDPKQVRADETDSTDDVSTTKGTGTDDGSSDGDDEGDDGAPAIAAPPTVVTDGLTGPGLDLANAINTASTLTYHATYEGESVGSGGTSSTATVEVWRQLPLARRDTTIASSEGTLRTRELRLRDQLVGCVDRNKDGEERDWLCVSAAGKGVDPAEPLLGTSRPSTGTVTVRDDTIGGVPARCYSVDGGGKLQEACFDGDGIPVSIDGGDGRLVRAALSRGVDPDTVALPEGAEVQTSPSAT